MSHFSILFLKLGTAEQLRDTHTLHPTNSKGPFHISVYDKTNYW